MWGQLRLRSLPPADLTHPEMTKSDNGPTQNGLTLLVLLEKLYLIERYWIIQWCQKRTRDSGIQLYNKWKFWI